MELQISNDQVVDAVLGGKLVFEKMDDSGDKKSMWDPTIAIEVAEARREFEKYTKEHKYKAYKVNPNGDQGEPMDVFEANAGRVIFIPPMQGD